MENTIDNSAVLYEAVMNAAKCLTILDQTLSIILQSDVTLMNHKIEPESNSGLRALYFIRVFKSLYCKFDGNCKHMTLWLTGHVKHIDAVPLDTMKTENGLVSVMEYLEAFSYTQY